MFSTLKSLSVSTHFVVFSGLKPQTTLLRRYILTRPPKRSFTSGTRINTAGGPQRPSNTEPQNLKSDESLDSEVFRDLLAPRYDDSARSGASTRPSSSSQGIELASTNMVRLSNLPYDADDSNLRDFFTSCGRVLSTDIWTNASGRATGRGTATFAEIADAQAALALNGGLLLGRRIKITVVRPLLPSATLLVTNVAYHVQEEGLWTLFSEPKPLQIRVPPPRGDRPRGFAHVQYRTVEEAQLALKKYNGGMLEGRPLDIFFAAENETDKLHTKKNAVPARSPCDTLFVGNVHFDATESDVRSVFAEFQPVAVYIARDHSGRSLASGQVKFQSVDDARRAMEACAGKELLSRPLRVEFALRGVLNPPCDTLFVGNIAWKATNEELQDVFAEFDPIAFIRRCDREGRLNPYAHVTFRSAEEAQRVLDACHNRVLYGRPLAVVFATPDTAKSGPGARSPDTDHDNDTYAMPEPESATKYQVRVMNVPPDASVHAITKFFATRCGTVLSVTKGTNGFGELNGRVHVTLADRVGEKLALALDGSVFQGERMRITALSSPLPTATLFIKNLAYSVTREDLWGVFGGSALSKPLKVRLPLRPRGYAHVVYRTAAEAEQARESFNQYMLLGRAMQIFFVDDGLIFVDDGRAQRAEGR